MQWRFLLCFLSESKDSKTLGTKLHHYNIVSRASSYFLPSRTQGYRTTSLVSYVELVEFHGNIQAFHPVNSVIEQRSQVHASHSCSHNTQLRALGQFLYLLVIVTKIICFGHIIGMGEGIEEGIWPSKARVPLECPCEVVKFLPCLLGCQALRICGLPSLTMMWRVDIGDRSALDRLLGRHVEGARRCGKKASNLLFKMSF